jgi:hypothetical protein
MHHVGFMISPELHEVQGKVLAALNLTWFRAKSAMG